MKSRKILKKEIHKSFDILYTDCILYQMFVPNSDVSASDAILDKAQTAESEFISRVNIDETKEIKGKAKVYFTQLIKDVEATVSEIAKEIKALPL